MILFAASYIPRCFMKLCVCTVCLCGIMIVQEALPFLCTGLIHFSPGKLKHGEGSGWGLYSTLTFSLGFSFFLNFANISYCYYSKL